MIGVALLHFHDWLFGLEHLAESLKAVAFEVNRGVQTLHHGPDAGLVHP